MMTAGPESSFFLESDRHRRSLWAAIVTGLFAALSATILLCRSPQTSAPQMVLVLAGGYLVLAALFGTTGSYVYWLRSYARPALGLPQLLQSTIRGWYWIPAIVLLFRKDSIWAPAVAAAGAAVLAFSLRRAGPAALGVAPPPAAANPTMARQHELFAECLQTVPFNWSGPIVAICIYAEVLVLLRGWLFAGCALLALAAFTFAWARTPAANAQRYQRRITFNSLLQVRAAVPALIITILAMLMGAGHDLHLWGMGLGHGHRVELPKTQAPPAHNGLAGHLSIILLTAPQKQQFTAPQPSQPLLQGDHLNKPMVIQFDGEYWYFQPPDSGPGPSAYVAHESPLVANVHSVLAIPLLMQAHQHLGSPLPLACCRQIEVEIENRDQNPGSLDLGMSLSNSATPGKTVLLGVQHLQSSQGDQWRGRSTPAHETLRFTIPAAAKDQTRQFDQIDMLIIPSPTRMQSGAKIAIHTLKFLP